MIFPLFQDFFRASNDLRIFQIGKVAIFDALLEAWNSCRGFEQSNEAGEDLGRPLLILFFKDGFEL